MPAAVAIPAIASVATAGLGYLGSRQTDQQKALLAQQTQNAGQQSALAKQMQDLAGQQSTLTGPAYKQALDYYSSLAGAGGRAKQQQAVMPDINRLSDQYKGAADNIARSLRGPARDQALADLVRQHAMQVGELTGAPRAAANQTLLGAGQQGQQTANNLLGAASGAYGGANVGAQGVYNALTNQQIGQNNLFQNLGQSFSNLWAPYLKNLGSKAGGPSIWEASGQVNRNPWQIAMRGAPSGSAFGVPVPGGG